MNNTEEIGKYIILERSDLELPHIQILEGPLESNIFQINEIKFGEQENPDGSIDLHINYDLIKGNISEMAQDDVSQELGDIVIDILERQLKLSNENIDKIER